MTDRKTLKVNHTTKERFDRLKKRGETTDGLLHRAFDAIEAEENRDQQPGAPRCTDCGAIAHAWTVEAGMLLCGSCSNAAVELE